VVRLDDIADDRGQDELLASSVPPATFGHVHTWVLDSARELSALRGSLLAAVNADVSVPAEKLDDIADAMVLVASELATNALKHGIPPTTVRLLRDAAAYLLDVADHDASSTPYISGERAPGEGGYGLQIARRIAVEVGWYAIDGTKHVWAILPAPRTV
jgi:serine/threonine-protein kinase RsbW